MIIATAETVFQINRTTNYYNYDKCWLLRHRVCNWTTNYFIITIIDDCQIKEQSMTIKTFQAHNYALAR